MTRQANDDGVLEVGAQSGFGGRLMRSLHDLTAEGADSGLGAEFGGRIMR